jgi:superfamily II DNA or RNA helicase
MRTKDQLRPYQNRVVTRFYESTAVLAVLKMGAGKTISALTTLWCWRRSA